MTTRSRLNGERGFTVVETLIATVLLIALGIATLGLVGTFGRAVGARATSSGGTGQMETTMTDMRNEASTAFAVFVPHYDVMGNPNDTGGTPAHEFDYYAKAEDGSESWWAYYFDVSQHTLRRYDYQPGGGNTPIAGVADRKTGIVNGSASYPEMTGVSSFAVHTLEASDLTTSANTFGPLISSLAASVGATAIAEPVGFIPNSNVVHPDLYGGNTTIEVSLTTNRAIRTFHLATGAAPSGFTIHAAPSIRSFVYRVDFSHRFWFGFAQKTWARIFEQLQYSYTPSVATTWKVWCDFQVYGANSDGLSLADSNANYQPNQWDEATAGVFYSTTQSNLSGLNAVGPCGPAIPKRNTPTATPPPSAGDPNVTDTPPPCFAAGTCWPQNAPADWSPPSPWPAQSPPPAWCDYHEPSTLCQGPGGPYTEIGPSAPPPDPELTSYPNPEPTEHGGHGGIIAY